MQTFSRRAALTAGVAAVALASGCDAEDQSADATGVYTLEQAPSGGQAVETSDEATTTGDTPNLGVPASPDEADASGSSNAADPSGTDTAPEASSPDPSPATDEDAPAEEKSAPDEWEYRPLASDSPEMTAFQQDVVALPAGFDGSMFTPPGHDTVTVVNRSTDRLSHEEAIAFMRDALAEAGWQVTEERDSPADKVRLAAERGAETVSVIVHLAVSREGEPDVVGITVEHTRQR